MEDFGEITEQDLNQLVRKLIERPILPDACEELGLDHYEVRMLMRKDDRAKDAIEVAIEVGADLIEAHAFKRAMGEDKSIMMFNGRPVSRIDPNTGDTVFYYDTNQSDRLLEMMLKAYKPEKYGNKAEVTHKSGTGVLMIPASEGAEIFQKMLDDTAEAARAEMEDFDNVETGVDATTWKPSPILKH